jgi:hypothetical protein
VGNTQKSTSVLRVEKAANGLTIVVGLKTWFINQARATELVHTKKPLELRAFSAAMDFHGEASVLDFVHGRLNL